MTESTTVGFDFVVGLIFTFVAALLLFPSNVLVPIDRRLASMLGANLCILVLYFFPEGHYINPTEYIDVQVMMVLPSIMIMNFLLLRQDWFSTGIKYLQHLIREDIDKGFFAVSALSFLISPFIMNDGLCLMLVHPVLDSFSHLPPNTKAFFAPSDPFYFMLTIACSSNIGSVLTYSGNPQNLIVASYLSSYMNCGYFFFLMLIPSVLSWLATTFLINHYRKQARQPIREEDVIEEGDGEVGSQRNPLAMVLDVEMVQTKHIEDVYGNDDNEDRYENSPLDQDRLSPLSPQKRSNNHQKFNRLQEEEEEDVEQSDEKDDVESMMDSPLSQFSDQHTIKYPTATVNNNNNLGLQKRMQNTGISLEELHYNKSPNLTPMTTNITDANNHQSGYNPVAMSWYVFGMIVLLIVLEFVGIFPLVGLFPILTTILLVTVLLLNYYRPIFFPSTAGGGDDAMTTSQRITIITQTIEAFFHEVDYNLLIIFLGLFIVSGTFLATIIPQTIWKTFAGNNPFQTVSSLIILSLYIIIASQLIGNVPLVYMAKEEVQNLDRLPQIFGWLVLSWVSTIAGNVTLVGSAANIIVAEKAMRHKYHPVHIGAYAHFRICGPITLVCISVGVVILYLETLILL